MRNKYITTQTLLAARTRPKRIKMDIYAELEKTIAERKKLVEQWEKIFSTGKPVIQKDIHVQLAETIAEFKKTKQLWDRRLFGDKPASSLEMTKTKAA